MFTVMDETPVLGRTLESRKEPNGLDEALNPTGGANKSRRFICSQSWRPFRWFLKLSGKRPVRTRKRGAVGAGGEKPLATRLGHN